MLSFKQFNFPPANQYSDRPFDPSQATKDFWLYTKKNEINLGINSPGLCTTAGYSTQMLAFFGILILEIAPTIYGIDQGLLWQAVAASIFVDIFLALAAHWWYDKILKRKNELVIEDNPVGRKSLEKEISRYKTSSSIFSFLIFVSGCIKAFLFYKAYLFFDAVVIGVTVCYLLGSVLHVNYTGYFIYTSRFYWFVNREYDKYIQTNRLGAGVFVINQTNHHPINTYGTQIEFVQTVQGLHSLYIGEDNQYYLSNLGIMTDEELMGFIRAQQTPIARDVVAREGLAIQLLHFNTAALNPALVKNNGVNLNQR